jgi:hypothetical protein
MVKTKKSKAQIESVPEQPLKIEVLPNGQFDNYGEPLELPNQQITKAPVIGGVEWLIDGVLIPVTAVSAESKPVIQSDQQIIMELQNTNAELIKVIFSVPKPEFFKLPEDAVKYQDEWARWEVQKRLTWNRLNL